MNNVKFLARVAALTLSLMLVLLGAAAAENSSCTMEEAGLIIHYSEELEEKGFSLSYNEYDELGNVYVELQCIDPELSRQLNAEFEVAQENGDNKAAAALVDKYYAHLNDIAFIITINKEDYETYKASGAVPFDPAAMTDLGEHNGYLYWAVFDSLEVGEKALVQSEAEIANWKAVAAELGDLSGVLEYIPVVKPDTISEGEMFPTFATKDMQGNDVTNDIFADKDLTIVNFWAITCGPCISELPELGEWARELPENVQIIGVLTDVTAGDAKKAAKVENIMSKAKAEFINLGADEVLYDYFSRRITGTPTTVLVNSCGEIVGDAIVGAYIEKYKEAVEAYLNGK